jgi:hypothetical protein
MVKDIIAGGIISKNIMRNMIEYSKRINLMKKLKIMLLSICLILSANGCSSLLSNNNGILGKATKSENQAKQTIQLINTDIAEHNVQRLTQIGEFSAGIDYSLDKISKTNQIAASAQSLNQRIASLAEKPSLNAVKEIQVVVDELLTNNTSGIKLLEKKDKQITSLYKEITNLQQDKKDAIDEYVAISDKTALERDSYQSTLKKLDSWGGLGAIFYGLKKLIIRTAWVLGLGSVLFLILRLLSATNPIAGAVFGVFDQIGSWLVHIIQIVLPKAVAIAGNVSTKVFATYQSTMKKIVDGIALAQNNAQAAGKEATLKDYLNLAEQTMTPDEKAIVDEIKKQLNW